MRTRSNSFQPKETQEPIIGTSPVATRTRSKNTTPKVSQDVASVAASTSQFISKVLFAFSLHPNIPEFPTSTEEVDGAACLRWQFGPLSFCYAGETSEV
jgi:hypothetical protein